MEREDTRRFFPCKRFFQIFYKRIPNCCMEPGKRGFRSGRNGANTTRFQVLYRLVLHIEKDRPWRELSAEAEADRRAGKLDRLSDLVREARADLRRE
jgi:hypothetical protein